VKCGKKNNIFYLVQTNPDNTVSYRKIEHDKDEIIYNADRSFKEPEGGSDDTYLGCIGKTTDQLYAVNRAFNFVARKPSTPYLTEHDDPW